MNAMRVSKIRIPESIHERLTHLAKARGLSLRKIMEELGLMALAQHDAEVRFRALAARGSRKTGLALLNKLDRPPSQRRRS